jgi:hypothetical protein
VSITKMYLFSPYQIADLRFLEKVELTEDQRKSSLKTTEYRET